MSGPYPKVGCSCLNHPPRSVSIYLEIPGGGVEFDAVHLPSLIDALAELERNLLAWDKRHAKLPPSDREPQS